MKDIYCLAIESSCDETSMSIIKNGCEEIKTIVNNFKEVNNISGNGFPPILVAVEDVDDYDVTQLSRGKHLCIKSDDVSFIKWNFTDWDDIKPSGKFSAVGTLEESYFGKKVTQQLIINDFNFT